MTPDTCFLIFAQVSQVDQNFGTRTWSCRAMELSNPALMNNFNFPQFHEHIFRRSSLQMFFKISPPINFTIFWMKKRLRQRWFPVHPVNIAKFLKEQLSYRTPQVANSYFATFFWRPNNFFFSTRFRHIV